MKYDVRACKFNMDTGCVELLLRDGSKISINCTGVEDALDVMKQQPIHLPNLDAMIENFDQALTHPDEEDLERLKQAVR